MRVRRAEPADLGALVALEETFPSDRLEREALRRFLGRGSADVFVAEAGARIVGDAIVLYRRGFQGARLYSLAVDPDARGRGVAGRLLDAVEAAAVARGCVVLRLEVREDNEPARALYLKHGYEPAGRTADYYQDGSAALRMRKRLREGAANIRPVPYYPQTMEFTCGPACLMMAFAYLGAADRFERGDELELWREATTVFMQAGHGGCSAHGLAVAALRREVDATVYARDDSVPFQDSVRSEDKKAVVALAHERFGAEMRRRGGRTVIAEFDDTTVVRALERREAPILLVSGSRFYAKRVPHWVVATGWDDDAIYVHDPFVPEGAERADGVHLPLARSSFASATTFGKARHRYLLVLAKRDGVK